MITIDPELTEKLETTQSTKKLLNQTAVDPFNKASPQNFSIKSKFYMPVTLSNDEKKFSLARNEIRRQYFFHADYNPSLDEPS